jgi:hypothetical protein
VAVRLQDEELDLEVRADVAVGHERDHPAAREPLDGADELLLHGQLEGVAGLGDDRGALQLDHRLLHVGVDAAQHADEQVAAHELRLRRDRLAVVIALVERHHGGRDRLEELVALQGSVGGRHRGRPSSLSWDDVAREAKGWT